MIQYRDFLCPCQSGLGSENQDATERYVAMYSAVAQEHFHNQRRVGPLEGATRKGTAGTPGEGPYVVLWLRIEDEVVQEAAYRTFGCPAAIAAASMVCEMAEGQTVGEARGLTEAAIVAALNGLPEGKEHCPPLAVAALRDALQAGV